jgi:hypothetical protein
VFYFVHHAYRDKKVVGVSFVRFRAPLQSQNVFLLFYRLISFRVLEAGAKVQLLLFSREKFKVF